MSSGDLIAAELSVVVEQLTVLLQKIDGLRLCLSRDDSDGDGGSPKKRKKF